jgi:hypothetical protein
MARVVPGRRPAISPAPDEVRRRSWQSNNRGCPRPKRCGEIDLVTDFASRLAITGMGQQGAIS